MNRYENPEVCKNCGGFCCKHMGCHFSPEDFKEPITINLLRQVLDTGMVSIDYWENASGDFDVNDYRVFFLRMRNVGSPVCDPAWGGTPCIRLTDHGCPLPFDERPKGARLLIPNADRRQGCKSEYTKRDSVEDWLPYYDILAELWDEYQWM